MEDSYDSPTVPFVCTVKNAFFQKIFSECFSCNWVDIENEYYNSLKTLLGEKENSAKAKGIEELNRAFKFLIEILERYLTKQPKPEGIHGYLNIFKEKILKEDVVTIKMEEDLEPTDTLILNFNYTSTLNLYYEYNRKVGGSVKMPQVNYIHGQLNDKENPIVFGFGDELDEDFKKIEGDKMKGFLNYVKSFFYFKTINYHDLIRFIESDNYQVVILGHSCGLSDRTMLNMIFEHEKCKSIKIYYHGTKEKNNYTELTQEISRHFTNKGEMRKKIVPLVQSLHMPQA